LVLSVQLFRVFLDSPFLVYQEDLVNQQSILTTCLSKQQHKFPLNHLRNILVPADRSFLGLLVFQDRLVDLVFLVLLNLLAYRAFLVHLLALVHHLHLFLLVAPVDPLVPSYQALLAYHHRLEHLLEL